MGQRHVSVNVPKNSAGLYITTERHRLDVITNFWSKNASVYEQLTRTFKYIYAEMSFFSLEIPYQWMEGSVGFLTALCYIL